MLIVGLVTLAAIAGAVTGAVAASANRWTRHMLPFSAGLLVGMSLLLMAPEAFADGAKPATLAAFALGFLMVSLIEKILHRLGPDPHQTLGWSNSSRNCDSDSQHAGWVEYRWWL